MRLVLIAGSFILGGAFLGWGLWVLIGGGDGVASIIPIHWTAYASIVIGLGSVTASTLAWLEARKKPSPVNPIDWHEKVHGDLSAFQLLDWRRRLVPLVGRDREKAELLRWCREGKDVRVRFLTGEGGAGKTRLAAEVADELAREGWQAGFVKRDAVELLPQAKPRKLLLLVDYPERNREETRKLLEQIADIPEGKGPVRALFLSRQDFEEWVNILPAHARSICSEHALALQPLEDARVAELFRGVAELFGAAIGRNAPPVSADAIVEWVARHRDLFRYPLLVVAAAVNYVRDPDHRVGVRAVEILNSLLDREFERMRDFGKVRGFGEETVARLAALASVRGGINAAALRRIARAAPSGFEFPKEARLIDAVEKLDWWRDGALQPMRPDILAAALVHRVLTSHAADAPEWLWLAIDGAEPEWATTADRIDYDIRRVHGPTERRFGQFLAAIVEGNLDRAKVLAWLPREFRTAGTLRMSIVISQELLKQEDLDDEQRGLLLNNLSNYLSDAGDNPAALEAIQEAVAIDRRLAAANPARFEPDLALSLNNLSLRLSDAGDNSAALEPIRDAVAIFRRLAAANPARFEPDLARSLNNLSESLSAAGNNTAALEAIRDSVAILRRLAAANSARFEPELASGLNNLSKYLNNAGDNPAALEAIQEAVAIRRRLAAANSARFEPDVAMSLNNLSLRLSDAGDNPAALKAIHDAVAIYRRLAAANPARFEPNLATSFCVLGLRREESGDIEAAIQHLNDAIALFRQHESSSPGFVGRHLPDAEQELARLLAKQRSSGE